MKDKKEKRMIKKPKISAIVIAKNEEEKIGDCFESLAWADEIVIIDSGSEDKTIDIAKKHNARIFEVKTSGYHQWRNEGLAKAEGDWVLYVDADERVPPTLKKEIKEIIKNTDFSAFAIPRRNIILGKEMKHGGLWPDYVKRLYRKDKLESWKGELHEEPVFQGEMGHLQNPLIHIKHAKLSEMVEKTNKWSEVEAELLLEVNHPKMAGWRFFRIMFGELWLRLIKKKGFLDGAEGFIYAFYQMWSRFLTYAKLWEMQIQKGKG